MWAQIGLALGLPATSPNLPAAVVAKLSEAPALVMFPRETAWEGDTLATEELFAVVGHCANVALTVSLLDLESPGGPRWAPFKPLALSARTKSGRCS